MHVNVTGIYAGTPFQIPGKLPPGLEEIGLGIDVFIKRCILIPHIACSKSRSHTNPAIHLPIGMQGEYVAVLTHRNSNMAIPFRDIGQFCQGVDLIGVFWSIGDTNLIILASL